MGTETEQNDIDDSEYEYPGIGEDEIEVNDGGFTDEELDELNREDEEEPEEEDEEGEGEEEGEEEYDEGKASAPVQRKVNELTEKWRTAERALNRLRAESDEGAVSRHKARAERRAAENEAKQAEFKAREEKVAEKTKLAQENEDWAILTEATQEGNRLMGDRSDWNIKQLKEEQEDLRAAPATTKKAATGEPDLTPEAKDWVEKNKDWFLEGGKNYNAKRAARAMRLSTRFREEDSFSVDDPELYRKIDRSLGLKRGKKKSSRQHFNDADGRRARRGNPSSGSRGRQRPARKGSAPTARDWANMKRTGVDVHDKALVAQYMKYKNG